MSSLDVGGIRSKLEEEQNRFQDLARKTTLKGAGSKKVSRGDWSGTKTKRYYATVKGNVEKMLKSAGVDPKVIDSKEAQSLLSNRELLDKYLQATETENEMEDTSGIEQTLLEGGKPSTDPASFYGDVLGEVGRFTNIDQFQNIASGAQDLRTGIGGTIGDIGNRVGSNITGDIIRGIGGIVGGIDEGAMRRYGESRAQYYAQKDLQKKYANFLKKQGFENRVLASLDPKVLKRAAGLQALLKRKG